MLIAHNNNITIIYMLLIKLDFLGWGGKNYYNNSFYQKISLMFK